MSSSTELTSEWIINLDRPRFCDTEQAFPELSANKNSLETTPIHRLGQGPRMPFVSPFAKRERAPLAIGIKRGLTENKIIPATQKGSLFEIVMES